MSNINYAIIYVPEMNNVSPSYYKIFRTPLDENIHGRDRDASGYHYGVHPLDWGTGHSRITFDLTHPLPPGMHITHIRIAMRGTISIPSYAASYDLQLLFGGITPLDGEGHTTFTVKGEHTYNALTYNPTQQYGDHYLELDLDYTVPTTGGPQYIGFNYFRNDYTSGGSGDRLSYVYYKDMLDGTSSAPIFYPPFVSMSTGKLFTVDETITVPALNSANNYAKAAPIYMLQDKNYSQENWEEVTSAFQGEGNYLWLGTDFTYESNSSAVGDVLFDHSTGTYINLGANATAWITITFMAPEKLSYIYLYSNTYYITCDIYYLDSNTNTYIKAGRTVYQNNLYIGVETTKIKVKFRNWRTNQSSDAIYRLDFYPVKQGLLQAGNKFYPSYSENGDKFYIPEDGNTKYLYKIVAFDQNDNQIAGTQLASNITR